MAPSAPASGLVDSSAHAPARILVVDDDAGVRNAFGQVLVSPDGPTSLISLEQDLFGEHEPPPPDLEHFELQYATNSDEAVELVEASTHDMRNFSVAFVDVCMPPGPDGIETVSKIWDLDPNVEIVICSAYNIYQWPDLIDRFGLNDRFLLLRKPFDANEIRQLAVALWKKRSIRQSTQQYVDRLKLLIKSQQTQLHTSQTELREEFNELLRVEASLRHTQKLEAVGHLAAGLAHEINTPVQFIGDSIHFLREAMDDVMAYARKVTELATHADDQAATASLRPAVAQLSEEADLEYIHQEAPGAFERALDGVQRIADIVRAMKTMARDDAGQMAPADINEALSHILVVAHNAYKYVADVDLRLGTLPPVRCRIGDIGQVFLNLVINAAQAIDEDNAKTGIRGKITVETTAQGQWATIVIEDNGCGIPDEIKHKIFDPFFTTRAVGQGSGQGLAMCHSIVSDHGGQLECESTRGQRTRFTVKLPIEQQPEPFGSLRH